jgi:hypothetical protein
LAASKETQANIKAQYFLQENHVHACAIKTEQTNATIDIISKATANQKHKASNPSLHDAG